MIPQDVANWSSVLSVLLSFLGGVFSFLVYRKLQDKKVCGLKKSNVLNFKKLKDIITSDNELKLKPIILSMEWFQCKALLWLYEKNLERIDITWNLSAGVKPEVAEHAKGWFGALQRKSSDIKIIRYMLISDQVATQNIVEMLNDCGIKNYGNNPILFKTIRHGNYRDVMLFTYKGLLFKRYKSQDLETNSALETVFFSKRKKDASKVKKYIQNEISELPKHDNIVFDEVTDKWKLKDE